MIKVTYYLNKLTGEVLGSREKRKFDNEVLSDKSLFQTLQGHKPVIVTRLDENGDFEGKLLELSEVSYTTLQELSFEGYGLNVNFTPNLELSRKFKICSHCLHKIYRKNEVNRINLDEFQDYIEYKKKEFRYYSVIHCGNCNQHTTINQYISKFSSLSDIPNLQEIVIDHTEEMDIKDNIFKEQKITEIVFGKVYNITNVSELNDIKNHEAVKTLLRYQDMKELAYIKFKRINNYFQSSDFVKKYKVKSMI